MAQRPFSPAGEESYGLLFPNIKSAIPIEAPRNTGSAFPANRAHSRRCTKITSIVYDKPHQMFACMTIPANSIAIVVTRTVSALNCFWHGIGIGFQSLLTTDASTIATVHSLEGMVAGGLAKLTGWDGICPETPPFERSEKV